MPTVGERQVAVSRAISPGYLATLGVPLLRGRHIDQRDGPASLPVVVINETMARTFWGSGDPVGHRIKFGNLDSPTPWLRVIGVVGDVREIRLDLAPEPDSTCRSSSFPRRLYLSRGRATWWYARLETRPPRWLTFDASSRAWIRVNQSPTCGRWKRSWTGS